jgi:hypothetical protein
MEKAFEAGNDPVLTLANFKGKTKSHHETVVDDEMETEEPWTQHLRRREQDTIDNIVQGTEPGHYFMLLGPKVRTRLQVQRNHANENHYRAAAKAR